MQCNEFDVRLQQVLDRRKVPETDARLVSHGKECARCRRLLMSQQALFHELELGTIPGCSVEFEAKVIARLRPGGQTRSWRRYAWAIPAAAAAMILFWLVSHSTTGVNVVTRDVDSREGGSRGVVAQQNAVVVTTGAEDVLAPQDTTRLLAAVEYGWIDTPSNEIPEVWNHWHAQLRTVGSLWVDRQHVTGGDRDWMGEFAGGLKPLANSMSSALHVLRSTIAIDGEKDNHSDGPQVRVIRSSAARPIA